MQQLTTEKAESHINMNIFIKYLIKSYIMLINEIYKRQYRKLMFRTTPNSLVLKCNCHLIFLT